MGCVVGIDPGEVRIGVAVSDETASIAFPRETVDAGRGVVEAAKGIRHLLADEQVDAIVVGLPLRLDGTEGEAARRARALGSAVQKELRIDVRYWDERLTTVTAERSLREAGVPSARRRDVVDQSAAAIMLQGYLDARKNESWEEPSNQTE